MTRPFGAPPEPYETILEDIYSILRGKANVDHDTYGIDALLSHSVSALCRRFCELGAAAGLELQQTSADILICLGHDKPNGVIDLALAESYPCYGLDRYIVRSHDGFWNVHTHQVHYKGHNPKHNNSMVARELLAKVNHLEPPKWDDLDRDINTRSEDYAQIDLIHALVPPNLRDFSEIEPGMVVAADIIYYKSTHRGAAPQGRNTLGIELERWRDLEYVFGEIAELSKPMALDQGVRMSALTEVADFLRREGRTIRDIATAIWGIARG